MPSKVTARPAPPPSAAQTTDRPDSAERSAVRRRARGHFGEPGRSRRETSALGIAMMLPAMVPFVLFLLLPIVVAFWFSFHESTGYSTSGAFVGFDNYAQAIGDARLWFAVVRNVVLALATIVLAVGAGFVLAYFIFRQVAGWKFLQVGLFVPYVLPVAVVALLWTFILDPNFGLLNVTLESIGLDSFARNWLGSPSTALGSVTLVWGWRLAPFIMLIIYGAMLRIPDELLEAAQIDGAGEWRMMTRIVFPLVRPTVALGVLITAVVTFRTFDMVWILTQGGPQGATRIATLYLYEQGFQFNNFGYGNALGFIVAILIIVPALLLTRTLNRFDR